MIFCQIIYYWGLLMHFDRLSLWNYNKFDFILIILFEYYD